MIVSLDLFNHPPWAEKVGSGLAVSGSLSGALEAVGGKPIG